jgi:hypothetical protein
MELFLIDAIGPSFRGYDRKRVNWSKIPFMHLADVSPDGWVDTVNEELRQRYRIKVSFTPFPVRRRTLGLAANLLLRRKRGYRWVDRIFILHLSGLAYRLLRPRDPSSMPKFLRKSAMGVDVLFK